MTKNPIIKIKLKDLTELGKLQCSEREVAGFLNIKVSTLRQLFTDEPRAYQAYLNGMEHGKVGLRRKQMRLAAVNATMAIFMGKQYLGQKDIVTNEHSGIDGDPIEMADVSKLSSDERKQLRNLITKSQRPGTAKET